LSKERRKSKMKSLFEEKAVVLAPVAAFMVGAWLAWMTEDAKLITIIGAVLFVLILFAPRTTIPTEKLTKSQAKNAKNETAEKRGSNQDT
jgi:positive regulator of sigma E activity